MKQLFVLLLVFVSLLFLRGAALADASPAAPGSAARIPNRALQTVVVSAQVSRAEAVALASDGAWTKIVLKLDTAPPEARVHHIAVKYVTTGIDGNQVSAKLRAKETSQTHLLQPNGSTNRVMTDTNIEAFNGAPVNQTWTLSVRGPVGASGASIDGVTLKVYYETQMTPLVVTGDGARGAPSIRTRPAGSGASKPQSGGKSENTAPTASTGEKKSPRATPPPPPTRRERNAPDGWNLIGSEDFEGVFPTGLWNVSDQSNDGFDRYWDDDNENPSPPSAWAAWPANGGADGLQPAFDVYPNNMNAWMIYGPIDLSDATAADFTFSLWYITEAVWDTVSVCASHDNVNFSCNEWSGNSNGWLYKDIDLSSHIGDQFVWIAWIFESDGSVVDVGPWVDDIDIWKQTPDCYTLTGAVNPAGSGNVGQNPAPNCNGGTQYTSGTNVTLTATANSGYVFSSWSGSASGSANPTIITMDANKSVTAAFVLLPQVFVDQTWVANTKNQTITQVFRGQKVRYYAALRNPSTLDCAANASWLVKAQGTTLATWNGALTITPGTSNWYLQKKIPVTAPYKRYKLLVTSICNGVTSTAISKFKVVPNVNMALDDDKDIDGPPVRDQEP